METAPSSSHPREGLRDYFADDADGAVDCLPVGGQFSSSKLGPAAKAFLDLVNGSDAAEPYTITGNLNFMADVPIAPIAPLLAELGIAAAPTIHLQGSAGFTLAFLDGGTGSLDTFSVEATLASVGGTLPNGWPTWLDFPSTGEWTLFLRFAEGDPSNGDDDSLELGVSIEGITSTLFPGLSLTLEASFSGEISGSDPEWTIVARAAIGTWAEPFGIDFLTVNNASAVLTIHQPASGGSIEASAELCGTFTIASGGSSVETTVCFVIESTDPGINATFRISLDEAVTLQDIVGFIPGLNEVELPGPVGSASVGPGELDFTVTGDGVFSINAVIAAGFAPFGNPVGINLMLSANFGAGTPVIAVGVQPQPGTTLGGILNLDLPVDLPLAPATPNTGFAFVYTNAAFDPDVSGLPQSIRDWFLPLYAGNPTDKTLPSGPSVLGAFALPEPLGEFVSALGMDPNVLVSGGFTFEASPAVDFNITLRLRNGLLPEFIDNIELTLGISLETAPPALEFSLDGYMYLKFKQGLDADMAAPLQAIGVNLPVAAPVAAGFICPRGGFNLPTTEDDGVTVNNYCYDKLKVFIGTELGVTTSPPAVTLRAFGGMVTQNTGPGATWSPLGIEEIGIGALGAEIEISFEPAPLALSIKLGLYGDITLFDYDVSAGVKVGVTVVAAPTPIGIAVTPNFDGLRISLPDGLETNGVIDLANVLAEAVGAPPVPYPSPATFPNIGLKNLYFSISPVGAPNRLHRGGPDLPG